MTHEDRSHAEELDRYWDDLVLSGRPPASDPPDPETAATIHRLWALSAPPHPERARARVWQRLQQREERDMAAGDGFVSPRPRPAAVLNGHGGAPPLRRLRPHGDPERQHWADSLATAALVVLTLIGSFVVFSGLLRPSGHNDRSVGIPVREGAPANGLLPGVTEDTILMHGTFDVIPPGAGWTGIVRTTLAPGAEWTLGTRESTGEGLWLYRVESGQLTITADTPIVLIRAGEEQATTIPTGTDAVLRVADRGFTPSGVTSRWRNDGAVPAVIMKAGVATLGSGITPAGVSDAPLIYELPYAAPAPPIEIAVRRLTLPSTVILPVEAVPGLELLYIESGQLEAFDGDQPDATANPLTSSTSGQGLRIVDGSNVLRTFPAGRVFRSVGADPVTLLLLTITDANPD